MQQDSPALGPRVSLEQRKMSYCLHCLTLDEDSVTTSCLMTTLLLMGTRYEILSVNKEPGQSKEDVKARGVSS